VISRFQVPFPHVYWFMHVRVGINDPIIFPH
jgi:hypothetical protein